MVWTFPQLFSPSPLRDEQDWAPMFSFHQDIPKGRVAFHVIGGTWPHSLLTLPAASEVVGSRSAMRPGRPSAWLSGCAFS